MTIAIKPTASGSTIEQNGSTILTVDGSGNVDVANNLTSTGNLYPKVPVFSARLTADQTFSSSTWTKAEFGTEDFDTNSNYDTTNYRFTPTVAGYYHISSVVRINYTGSANDTTYLNLYKNGSSYVSSNRLGASGLWGNLSVSVTLYLNGSTDYVETYVNTNHASPFLDENAIQVSKFSGHLVSV